MSVLVTHLVKVASTAISMNMSTFNMNTCIFLKSNMLNVLFLFIHSSVSL